MPRWEPDARERHVVATLQLFSEHWYDETTVAVIADRVGLTKNTFHRHFPDKRDVLATGQETLSRGTAPGFQSVTGVLGARGLSNRRRERVSRP